MFLELRIFPLPQVSHVRLKKQCIHTNSSSDHGAENVTVPRDKKKGKWSIYLPGQRSVRSAYLHKCLWFTDSLNKGAVREPVVWDNFVCFGFFTRIFFLLVSSICTHMHFYTGFKPQRRVIRNKSAQIRGEFGSPEICDANNSTFFNPTSKFCNFRLLQSQRSIIIYQYVFAATFLHKKLSLV